MFPLLSMGVAGRLEVLNSVLVQNQVIMPYTSGLVKGRTEITGD